MQKYHDINMNEVVGDHELTIVPHSLFASDDSLLDGTSNKANAMKDVLADTTTKILEKLPYQPECVAMRDRLHESCQRNEPEAAECED